MKYDMAAAQGALIRRRTWEQHLKAIQREIYYPPSKDRP